MSVRRGACWLLLCLPLGACSAIPTGGDPWADPSLARLAAGRRPRLGRAAVAPIVTSSLAASARSKGWAPEATSALDPRAFQGQVGRALEAAGTFEAVRLPRTGARAEAWDAGDDVLVNVEVGQLR